MNRTESFNPEEVTLVYLDELGNKQRQTVDSLTEIGTLISPESGEDLPIIRVEITRSPKITETALAFLS